METACSFAALMAHGNKPPLEIASLQIRIGEKVSSSGKKRLAFYNQTKTATE